jgi:tetratricopeptide (TPR) repeat protein
VRWNLAGNLCQLGQCAEAELLLPSILSLAATLGGQLDRVRLRWLQGKIAAGQRRPEEALSILAEVRREFVSRSLVYDAALVTVELSDEAQALLDQALAIDCWGETPSLLIAAAKAVEETGDFEQAIALLARAAAHPDPERDPRRLFLVRKNIAINLCHLGRHAEAQRLLPSLRSTAASLDNDLEILRLQWLEARVTAGLGDPADALAALVLVRSRFVALDLAYDAALVTLELAEIHVQLGHTAEVKTLAHSSVPIFHAQGVHREARMALDLFRHAADREAATADLLRRLVAYLYRAQRDPHLPFAPPA